MSSRWLNWMMGVRSRSPPRVSKHASRPWEKHAGHSKDTNRKQGKTDSEPELTPQPGHTSMLVRALHARAWTSPYGRFEDATRMCR